MNAVSVNISYSIFENTTTELFLKKVSPIWRLEYTILAVMISSLAVVGILGNIPVLIVYFRRRDNLPTHTFIKVLAFIDLLVCAIFMPYTIVYELHLVTSDMMCRLCEFMRHCSICASAITLVAIATERYIAVCQISIRLNINSINVGVWVIFGLGAILAAPAVGTFAVVHDWEVQDIPCHFPHVYTTGTFCHFTYTLMGKAIVTAYQVLQTVVNCIAILILTILYSVVYYVLWKKALLRRKMMDRKCINSEMDSSSEVSYWYQCRQLRCKPTNPCIGPSSISDRGKDSVPSYQNSEMCSELISNGLNERDSAQDYGNSKGIENLDMSRKGTGTCKHKTIRRKIRFSVSAQSGRSEKLKRKKYYHQRTAKMLFLCTVIYIVTWLPFWFDIFGLTDSLILRYMFFIGNSTNPIVYGIVNEQVRRAFKGLFFDYIKRWFRFELGSDHMEDTSNMSGTAKEKSNK